MEQFKTYFLMIGLTLLFIWFGALIAGETGMIIAFIATLGMNFYAYFYSREQVLRHYNAIPVDRYLATGLDEIVERLARKVHWPCAGTHTHHYTPTYNQNPVTCECFLKDTAGPVDCRGNYVPDYT